MTPDFCRLKEKQKALPKQAGNRKKDVCIKLQTILFSSLSGLNPLSVTCFRQDVKIRIIYVILMLF